MLVVVALLGGLTAGAGLFIGGALAARDASVDENTSGDGNESSTTSTTSAPTTTTSTTIPPTTTTTAAAAADGALESGEHGPEVDALQARLSDLGYWLGTADGTYGQLTRQAVMAFQKATGLSRDGVAGPATLAAIETAGRVTPRVPSGSHIEIDLDRQILIVVQDGQTRWVLNTSTGNGEAYAAPGGGTAVAATPPGASRSSARSTASARRPSAPCTGRSTSTVASPSMARGRSPLTPRRTAALGSPTRPWTCCGRPGSPRWAHPWRCTSERDHASAGHPDRRVAPVT